MNSSTHVIQVTNVSPSTTLEQMWTLFDFLGNIEELKLFPPDDSPLPVTSRVCFVKFHESESVGVSQHLTNTVFVDRALIVVPFAEGVIPDESKAMSLLAPANAVAGMMPGAGLLPRPNPLASMGGPLFGGLGSPNFEQMAAMGIAGPIMNPQALSSDLLKFMQSMDPKLNPLAAGLNLNPGLNDSSNKEETMKRVREAQSLISAALEPGSKKDDKRKHSRSQSRRRRSRSRSRHRPRRRSYSRNRWRSPSHDRSHRRSRSSIPTITERHDVDLCAYRDRKEEKSKKRSKTPPKSYGSARSSRSVNRRRSSVSRSPKKHLTKSPSPRRHKKEKKHREKERNRERRAHGDQSREQREHSSSKKSKDKERDRKLHSDKGDVKVTRDYNEEEQGYASEKEVEEDDKEGKSDSDSTSSPKGFDETERGQAHAPKMFKVNRDDHHQEDVEMSD
ncbi:uncharacterized protein LOC144026663 isoform X2 [Festucalex cinctus]